MNYVTGDTHSDLTRIATFCKKFNTTTDDVMIILGDVGINYYGSEAEQKAKEKYNNLGITLFCIQGNHEERPYNFPSYKTKEWKGGTVYYEEEFPNIIFAKYGEIYDFDGKKCIVLGGAYSVDKWYRILRTYIKLQFLYPDLLTENQFERALAFVKGDIKDKSGKIRASLDKVFEMLPSGTCGWFKDEQPNEEIKAFVKNQIENNKEFDCVLSHTCPAKYIPIEMFISSIDQSSVDNSTEEWLDEIENTINYKKWYCGHWHTNKKIDKMHFLFEDFTEL